MAASVPQISVQLDVASHVTVHGDPAQVTLQFELAVQETSPPVPTTKSQLEPRHTMLAPVVAVTRQVAPSVHVASHVDAQLPLQAAVVQNRWQPLETALHPLAIVQPQERPSGQAQPAALHVH